MQIRTCLCTLIQSNHNPYPYFFRVQALFKAKHPLTKECVSKTIFGIASKKRRAPKLGCAIPWGGIYRFPTFTKFVVLFISVYSCSEVYSAPDRVGLFWLKTDNDRMWLSKCLFVPWNAQGFNNPF